jgi:hypothetical protein
MMLGLWGPLVDRGKACGPRSDAPVLDLGNHLPHKPVEVAIEGRFGTPGIGKGGPAKSAVCAHRNSRGA